MKIDKTILYIIEILLLVISICFLLFSDIFVKAVISIILLLFTIISKILIKSYKQNGNYNKEITITMILIGIIYVIAIYILGIYAGFYNSIVKFSKWSILNYIIPYIIIIICTENIRKTILLKEDKKSNVIMLIVTVIIDIALKTNIRTIQTLDDYYMLVGFIIFSSIANNLLYNYIIIKHKNCIAIIGYRLITTLYVYFIPITPNLHILFESILKMIQPYLIYLIIEANYVHKEKRINTSRGKRTADILVTSILVVLTAIVLILVSCKFEYGALVVGSGSMTGTINKGDIIIYKKLNTNDEIQIGDIIVFYDDDIRIIHRVINKKNSGKEQKYYTKGDANQSEDTGYRLEKDIVGKVKLRIPYLGQLTVLLNETFIKK